MHVWDRVSGKESRKSNRGESLEERDIHEVSGREKRGGVVGGGGTLTAC